MDIDQLRCDVAAAYYTLGQIFPCRFLFQLYIDLSIKTASRNYNVAALNVTEGLNERMKKISCWITELIVILINTLQI